MLEFYRRRVATGWTKNNIVTRARAACAMYLCCEKFSSHFHHVRMIEFSLRRQRVGEIVCENIKTTHFCFVLFNFSEALHLDAIK